VAAVNPPIHRLHHPSHTQFHYRRYTLPGFGQTQLSREPRPGSGEGNINANGATQPHPAITPNNIGILKVDQPDTQGWNRQRLREAVTQPIGNELLFKDTSTLYKVILPPSVGLSAPLDGVAALDKGRAIACATRLAPKHHRSAERGNITLKEY